MFSSICFPFCGAEMYGRIRPYTLATRLPCDSDSVRHFSFRLPARVKGPVLRVNLCTIRTRRDIGVTEVESCDWNLVKHSLLSTSNTSRRRYGHDSTSTRFGLGGILEPNVLRRTCLLESCTSQGDRVSRFGLCFLIEISGKLSGMDVVNEIKAICT